MGKKKEKRACVNCGRPLVSSVANPDPEGKDGVWYCSWCNSEDRASSAIFVDDTNSDEYVFIECPGATLYAPNSNKVIAGVKWKDENDPAQGYEIVKHPVYAPNHTKRRRIKREVLGKIRRCQACQDYTVRMRRKEGPDFFIPSTRYPGRKKLKPVIHSTRAPR